MRPLGDLAWSMEEKGKQGFFKKMMGGGERVDSKKNPVDLPWNQNSRT